jgi:hypothetical protein
MINKIEMTPNYEKGYFDIQWKFNGELNSLTRVYRENAYIILDELIKAQIGFNKPNITKEIRTKYVKVRT